MLLPIKNCYQYDQPLLFQPEWRPLKTSYRPYFICSIRQYNSSRQYIYDQWGNDGSKNTPFDFNTPKTIAPGVTDFDNEQVKFGNGFDHNWVLKTKGDATQVAAKLTCPTSGITLEVYTDEPGIQVYTGNFLDGTVKGKKVLPIHKELQYA